MFPASHLPRWLSPSLRQRDPSLPWQHLTIVSWSGMRGIVSLVAAVALPLTIQSGEPFPYREMVIFLSFAVILATLVVQGLTLAPLIRRLGVGADCAVEEEELLARLKTTHAGLMEVERLAQTTNYLDDDVNSARSSFQRRLRELHEADNILGPNLERHSGPGYRELRLTALGASRKRLIKLRRDGQIGDEVIHRIERELDLDEMRLG